MKLANYQKDAIVRAILADIPVEQDEVTIRAVQTALVKAMSPAARKLYRECPAALRTQYEVRLLFRRSHTFVIGDANFEAVTEPWRHEVKRKEAAASNLRAVVQGCNTLAALKKALPECEKYFPSEDAPTANLPALTNVVTDLVALGWPKTTQGA